MRPATPEPPAAPSGRRSPARVPGRWLLAVLLASIAPAGLAADGTLLMVSGRVEIARPAAGGGAELLVPVAGDAVSAGDFISTGDDGRVQIRFNDGSVISLQPRTRFGIDAFAFDANSQRGFFRLVHGALRTVTGAIGKRNHDDYRLITPTATIGVRGTDYVAEETVCDPDCSPGRSAGLRVAVSEGRVAVTNRVGSTEVPAGSAIHAADPDTPIRATDERPVLSSTALPRAIAGVTPDPGGLPAGHASPSALTGVFDAILRIVRETQPPADSSALADTAAGGSRAAGTVALPSESGTAESGPAPVAPRDLVEMISTGTTSSREPVASGQPVAGADGGPQQAASNEESELEEEFELGTEPFPPEAGGRSQFRTSAGELETVVDAIASRPGFGSDGTGSNGSGSAGSGPGTGDTGAVAPIPTAPEHSLVPHGHYTTRLIGLWLLQTPQIQGLLTSDGSVLTLDANRQLLSLGVCPGTRCLTRGTSRIGDGSSDPIVSWGRWIDGEARYDAGSLGSSHPQSPQAGMHYLLGIPTLTMPTSGTAGYSLLGATGATFSDGSRAPGTFTGSAVVRFGTGTTTRVALDARVTFAGDATYRITTTGGLADPLASNLTMTGSNTFQGNLGVQTGQADTALGCGAADACRADVTGGFLGLDAARLGLGYTINPATHTGTTINGVGVLRRDP